MTEKRNLPEMARVPKRTRSRIHNSENNCGAISSPAPATVATSTRPTATAIVPGTPAPVAKGKEVATTSENPLERLADATVTDYAILALVDNTFTYASGQEKLLQDFNKAMLNYTSGQEELARKFRMGTAKVLKSYLPEK